MKKKKIFHQHPDPQDGSRVCHFSSPAGISAMEALVPEQETEESAVSVSEKKYFFFEHLHNRCT